LLLYVIHASDADRSQYKIASKLNSLRYSGVWTTTLLRLETANDLISKELTAQVLQRDVEPCLSSLVSTSA